MSFKPRKLIEELPAVSHGGLIQAELTELGLKPEDIIDFSVSTNPFMPPPGIRDVISSSPIERYPDSTSAALTLKLAERHGLPAEAIVVASGTTELIRAVALACLRPRDKVIIIEPTYGEYEPAVRLSGGKILHLRAQEAAGFVPDIAAVINMISTYRPRALFLCNPNNPTGILLPEYDIERITASLGDTLLVLDEAYMTFIEAGWSSLDLSNRANVVIMRSMTKDYGLPGLRLGYAVTGSAIARYLRKVLPPWNVNAAAQAAGLAVLDMDDYLAETVRRTMEAKEYLVAELFFLSSS